MASALILYMGFSFISRSGDTDWNTWSVPRGSVGKAMELGKGTARVEGSWKGLAIRFLLFLLDRYIPTGRRRRSDWIWYLLYFGMYTGTMGSLDTGHR